MEDNILNYNYKCNYIPNEIQRKNETSNNIHLNLIENNLKDEINELKKKYLETQSQLREVLSQKEVDDRYIQKLESKLFLTYENTKSNKQQNNIKKIPKAKKVIKPIYRNNSAFFSSKTSKNFTNSKCFKKFDKNKIIIKNCNCVINLDPKNKCKKNLISSINKYKNQKLKLNNIKEERYLIINDKKKPLYINNKQLLGMKLKPLKSDNNEIIMDNQNNFFLYDLDGNLHNQANLQKIILDDSLPLVNENNIPILGINGIPIVDEYGDFLLDKKPLVKTKGILVDVLRDIKGKPIKILIDKKIKEPSVEIEIKPQTKLITYKDSNYYYYLKNLQRSKYFNNYNDKEKFCFEKSLRNYDNESSYFNDIYI